MRQKAHTLSAAEENILAQCGEMAAAPENIFSMFNNADIKFPYITDVEGNKIRITHGNFIDFLSRRTEACASRCSAECMIRTRSGAILFL